MLKLFVLEELPIIKERMIEAGNGILVKPHIGVLIILVIAAKKKVLDLYNHFKQRNNNSQDQYNHYNHISPTNAHYRYITNIQTSAHHSLMYILEDYPVMMIY